MTLVQCQGKCSVRELDDIQILFLCCIDGTRQGAIALKFVLRLLRGHERAMLGVDQDPEACIGDQNLRVSRLVHHIQGGLLQGIAIQRIRLCAEHDEAECEGYDQLCVQRTALIAKKTMIPTQFIRTVYRRKQGFEKLPYGLQNAKTMPS